MEILSISFLKPIIQGCIDSGINFQALANQTELKYFDYGETHNYVPMHVAQDALSKLARQQGIDNLADTFSDYIKLSALSDFGEIISVAPTLLDACRVAEKMSSAILSNEQLQLFIAGNTATFYQRFTGLDPRAYNHIMQVNLAYLFNGFDFATSDGWQPTVIHCQTGISDTTLDMFSQFSNATLYFDQPFTAIVFEASELSYCNSHHELCEKSANEQVVESVTGKVEKLIDSYDCDAGTLNMVYFSERADTSERTLRRRLADEGTTFQEIVASWRIRKSLELLKSESLSIREISQRLHYTAPNNFIRAFKQTFDCSPGEYRSLNSLQK